MIKLPTKKELDALMSFRNPHCLTLYSPYIETSSSENPNRIQLKNLLKKASQLLLADSLKQREINIILQPVNQFIENSEFLSKYPHNLALFISNDFFGYYRLPPKKIKPDVIVDKKFKLLHVEKLINNNLNYFVLSVSYNGAYLFSGDCYQIKKQKISNSMKQELNIDELPHERQFHNVAPASMSKKSERSHGQYNETQVNKDLLIKFFRKIDHKLHVLFKNKKTPLIIAGVDYLLPLYRKVNTYPYLLNDGIIGNLEHSNLNFIRYNACKIIGNQ